MITSYHTSAGNVVVNNLLNMNQFEVKMIMLLRYSEKLFDETNCTDLPLNIRYLFKNPKSRENVKEFISFLASNCRRPIWRHEPSCLCVGADENIFANLIKFSKEGDIHEAIILASFLVQSSATEKFVKQATIISNLFWVASENKLEKVEGLNIDSNYIH
jgi:hypothetical protein